jgi:hypothetical protein
MLSTPAQRNHTSKPTDQKHEHPQEEWGYVGKYRGQYEGKSMSLINSVRVTTIKNLKLVFEGSSWLASL